VLICNSLAKENAKIKISPFYSFVGSHFALC